MPSETDMAAKTELSSPTMPLATDGSLRVLHVIPSIARRYGGPSQAILGMCRALAEHAGVTVDLATTDADGPGGRIQFDESGYERIGIKVFPRTCSESWKYSRQMGDWLRSHIGQYDVVHVHGLFSYATLAACRSARRLGVPLVLRPCGMLAAYSRSRSPLRKSIYWRLVERRNVAGADWLHATTEEEKAELQELLPASRPVCIPLGVEEQAWHAPSMPGSFRRQHGIPLDGPLLLFLSRLHRKKGLADLLIPALAQLPSNVRLAVVGDVDARDAGYADQSRAAAEEWGVSARVHFVGPLYFEDKWAAYDDATAYVLPSYHENFGATVVEAMARGTAVVASREVQASQFVEQSGGGRVVPLEVDALAAALRSLLALSENERTAMGNRGREFARRELSWAGAARKLAAQYAVSARVSPVPRDKSKAIGREVAP
jgi:glycosyltransferase involved in cell wall biosynthesis